jgi:DNA-binding response OmpR family regulator
MSAKVRVLVVEDEAITSMMLCKELSKSGFEAINKAATAEDAERTFEEQRPDFIFMDIRLIGSRDGIDAAEAILEKNTGPVPIAFMTAFTTEDVRARAMRLEPVAYLVKPLNVKELRAIVEAAVPRTDR